MAKTKELLTDLQVEMEIERLKDSEDVKLAKMEQRIKNKRRQYMYTLRSLERRGRKLAAEGLTLENIEAVMLADVIDEVDGSEKGA
ncbi:MAG: hypothetical protein ACI4LK_09195 [Lentihominibacter sp.]